MRKKRFRPRDRNSLKLPAQSPVTPFVNCDATSEGEPAPTSDKVEKAAMTDDLRSFNIYTRHTTPPPHPLPKLEITEALMIQIKTRASEAHVMSVECKFTF